MLYPSIQNLTNDKLNRYSLVIAASKGARRITDKANLEREEAEMRHEDRVKDAKALEFDLNNEKAVSLAIGKIVDKKYKIIINNEVVDYGDGSALVSE